MDKLLANERVLLALLKQAAMEVGLADSIIRYSDEQDHDYLDIKEKINMAMRDLVIAAAVVEELWRTDIYRKAHQDEEEVATPRE